MKTISRSPTSGKPIALLKAAKILSKFISAENGASHIISAYLHRASSSFSELNQLHKEHRSPHSDQKHKRSIRSKTRDGKVKIEEKDFQSVEINDPSKDAEKSPQTIIKFDQEPDDATEYRAGTEGGSERLKKKKRTHEDEPSKHVIDEVEVEDEDKEGLEEKKHKKEKKKKKSKDMMNIKQEDEIVASRKDDKKETLSNGVVESRNGDSVGEK